MPLRSRHGPFFASVTSPEATARQFTGTLIHQYSSLTYKEVHCNLANPCNVRADYPTVIALS